MGSSSRGDRRLATAPRLLVVIVVVYQATAAAGTADGTEPMSEAIATHDCGDGQERFDGHRVLRITPRTESEVELLRNFENSLFPELDFWKSPSAPNRSVDVRVPESMSAAFSDALRRSDIAHTVTIENLQRLIDSKAPARRRRRSRRDLLVAYGSHREINQWLDETAARCGARCASFAIGSSHEGRTMKVIRVSGGGSAAASSAVKPAIWIDAGVHAREWIAPAIAVNFIHKLVNGYQTDPCTRLLVNKFVWYVLPVANPDGYEYSRTRNRMWRKNRTPPPQQIRPWWAPYIRANENAFICNGTDQNRNYGYNWGGAGSSNNPCSDTYSGPQAFSEPETRSLRDFLLGLRGQLRVYLTLHSYGQYWLYPWAYDRRLPPDAEDLNAVASAAAAAIARASGRHTIYTVGPAAKTLYAASGGSDDWAKGVAGVKYAFTVELPPADSDAMSTNGFVVPESDIQRIARETWPGIQAMARTVVQRECACPWNSDELRPLTEACTQR